MCNVKAEHLLQALSSVINIEEQKKWNGKKIEIDSFFFHSSMSLPSINILRSWPIKIEVSLLKDKN